MTQDFGDEFVNISQFVAVSSNPARDTRSGDAFDLARTMATQLASSLDFPVFRPSSSPAPRGIVFYLPPGRYLLPRLPPRPNDSPDGHTVYELPANVQLYVCIGALIRPDEGVDLVIRGSIRAGLYQIFGYDRYKPRTPERVGLNTVPLGRVIFAGHLVPALYPEWWGALPVTMGTALNATAVDLRRNDSTDSVQAAINAGCVTRDFPEPGSAAPHPRPSIPVLLGGTYNCYRNLSVDVSPVLGSGSCHLVLRGRGGVGTAGNGKPTIFHVIRPNAESGEGWLLRIGPHVSFELENLNLSVGDNDERVAGCLDIICDPTETPRRGLIRRCALFGGTGYTLRVVARDNDRLRHIVIDASRVSPGSTQTLSERGVDVDAGPSVMLHLDGVILGKTPIPGSITRPGQTPLPNPSPSCSTLHLRGGSVLLRAVCFHSATGPRPSRGNVNADDYFISFGLQEPDGQEVFLARPEGARSNHLTAVQVECQGWWFLSRPMGGDDHVVLLNLSHANVNWEDRANLERLTALTGQAAPPIRLPLQRNPGGPPSLVWLGSGGRCVLIGCILDWSFLLDDESVDGVLDVGTVFRKLLTGFPGRNYRILGTTGSICGPPFYKWEDAETGTLDFSIPHLVPYTIT